MSRNKAPDMTDLSTKDQVDADGYKLVPKVFKLRNYTYTFVEDLNDIWKIYSVYSPTSDSIIDYELVKFTKSEEYQISGNTIPKKWNYPSDGAFGRTGFSCASIEACKKKYEMISKRITDRDKEEDEIDIPKNKEFTIKALSEELKLPYTKVYTKVREMESQLKIVREVKNKTGKPTKIYIRL